MTLLKRGKEYTMAKYPIGLLEEELKNKVAADWFAAFDTTRIIGKVDFCVAIPATELNLYEAENALWAEAKAGVRKDIHESFVQLILTIGRARTFDTERPPLFLGAFDAEKIAFLPYNAVLDVFAQNDFNWNVPPSNHESKEFAQLHALAEKTIAAKSLLFNFEADEAELRAFIKANFRTGRADVSRVQIDKNNFTHIYRKWREAVLPHIDAPWDVLKRKYSLYDRDFYLAELNVDDNGTADLADDRVASDFYITFNANERKMYRVQRTNADELAIELTFGFKSDEGLAAYAAFWRRYKRPPRKDYWNYIVKRLDLLVPQDVRERKGAFFTPQKWVELSQDYLAKELGENWQDEYDIWDCCAGTGNMEAGLTNKYRVWASTLDQQDVDVMKERIKNGANLLESHVFQFDFLNDSFEKLPEGLREIVNDPERRKRLVIYINPPYAEASNARTNSGTGENRPGVSDTLTKRKYEKELGRAANELFAQFYVRIVRELSGATLGMFSKLKIIQSPNFQSFRERFAAEMARLFVVPANTFDNVKGQFPIGFQVWRTEVGGALRAPRSGDGGPGVPALPERLNADVYAHDGHFVGTKAVHSYSGCRYLVDWFRQFYDKQGERFAYLRFLGTDFQNNNGVFVTLQPSTNDLKQVKGTWITPKNVLESCVYFAVRLCIEATWLNDRDQFLYPNDGWKTDAEFLGDCLVYTLFHGQNRISSVHGPNHWIPFTEAEVDAKECFQSHFMSDLLAGKGGTRSVASGGKYVQTGFTGLTGFADGDCTGGGTRSVASADGTEAVPPNPVNPVNPVQISPAARAVLDAGRELWRYYHAQPHANPNASYYDIRRHFQGMKTTAKGKEQMNPTSADETYNALLSALRAAMKKLAAQIEPKVYDYGFLRK